MDNPITTATALSSFLLKYPSVRFVRLHWVDLSGIIRTRILTVEHCLTLESEGQYAGVGGRCMLNSVTDKKSPMSKAAGACELQPDWSSLRLCGHAPRHASVMCFVRDRYAVDPYHLCPRWKLEELLGEFDVSFGIQFLVGFEIEFVLLNASSQVPQRIDSIDTWCSTNGLRGDTLNIIEEIVDALQASNVPVLQINTQNPAQLEIATGPANPMAAIDALMHSYECIKSISIRHGLRATMTPKPLAERLYTGAHGHISMLPIDKKDNFLAGILKNLEILCAFGMPSYDSYWRAGVHANAAGSFVAWGTENRYVPVRGIEPGRWELRFLDATANLYLALAMTLASGLKGIKENSALRWADCHKNPSMIGESERTSLGIVTQMPNSMKDSIKILSESSKLDAALGKDLKQHYLSIKEIDEMEMGDWSEPHRREHFVKFF